VAITFRKRIEEENNFLGAVILTGSRGDVAGVVKSYMKHVVRVSTTPKVGEGELCWT